MGEQAPPRDAPAAFAAVGMPLLRGPGTIIGLPRQTVGPPPTPRIGTDGQGQGGKHLDRVGGLLAHLDEAPLESGWELPKVGGVSPQECALREGGEARSGMGPARGQERRSPRQLEKGTTNDHDDDLDIAARRHDTARRMGQAAVRGR
jgi:hypothetical protein